MPGGTRRGGPFSVRIGRSRRPASRDHRKRDVAEHNLADLLHDQRPPVSKGTRQGRAGPRPASGTSEQDPGRQGTSCTSSRWRASSTKPQGSGPSSFRPAGSCRGPGDTGRSPASTCSVATSGSPANTPVPCVPGRRATTCRRVGLRRAGRGRLAPRRGQPARGRDGPPRDSTRPCGASRGRARDGRIDVPVAVDAALEVGDLEGADRLAEALAQRHREVPPFLRAGRSPAPRRS